VHKRIGIELEGLGGKLQHRRKEGRAGHVGVLLQPRLEPSSDAGGLRHATDPSGMLHHPFAFSDGKLAEQKEALTCCGCHPVGVAATCVQEGGLSCPRRLLGQFDQFVLDLKGAERFEFPQSEDVGHVTLLILLPVLRCKGERSPYRR
jgi:hypothetical protein